MTIATLHAAGAPCLAGTGSVRVLADLVGYGLVSVLALACDGGLLLLFVALGVNDLLAATASFSAGMLLACTLNVRFVFADRCGISRKAEVFGFFAVGIAGLVATQLLLSLFVAKVGLGVAVAKIPTTGMVFLFNFLCRRHLVFTGIETP